MALPNKNQTGSVFLLRLVAGFFLALVGLGCGGEIDEPLPSPREPMSFTADSEACSLHAVGSRSLQLLPGQQVTLLARYLRGEEPCVRQRIRFSLGRAPVGSRLLAEAAITDKEGLVEVVLVAGATGTSFIAAAHPPEGTMVGWSIHVINPYLSPELSQDSPRARHRL